MKTISGCVVSSKPVSISKAASVMTKFISDETENGASSALSVYLRRTSAAINELVEFHKELKKSKRSDRKGEKSRLDLVESGGTLKENQIDDEKLVAFSSQDQSLVGVGEEQSIRVSVNFESEGKEGKKKRKKKSLKSDNEREREEVEKSKEKKKKKKRKHVEVENGGFDGSEERHRIKKKKKRKHERED